ncbi:putative 3-hydroxybutyryl-CoA dehydrogenase [Dietzia sp. NCCP-2495]|uniref:3-hydroxybutyryl-CoA dehydrogenase n=1 Tax=Dietzia sp. NCCP-2495 TaxID=2934675 RepID=UPI0016AE2D55|nr:3-hydroxybutyryl-CoA dehydrogenase [Dietzia sp. NCCP-2495]NLD86436.1 3-hydroxybutyryl-CoA dehydrogenase [Actinomycetales bacterium]GLB63471.1 putative 3-hydroxybutyryl-CoA dehydrogenase [Dietzia sp. NCCP-2495]
MSTTHDATADQGRITRVGVVGAGQMGSGIAEVCARAHVDVLVWESTRELAAAGRGRVLDSLDRGVSSGKITERERDRAALRLRFTTDLGDFADRQLVIEAIVEDEDAKTAVFRELDSVVTDPQAVLASNTSSIPIMKLGTCTTRPERVIGMHFFNPVPVLPLVELVSTLETGDRVRARAEHFAQQVLGKQVIHSADRSGAVVNALLVPYLLSAIRMAESGFATPEDIDKAMVLGCAHPMGPLSLADHVGLDTVKAIADSMYAEFREPMYAPPALLMRMVEAGRLGKKSGHGFFRYSGPRALARVAL